MLRVPKKLVDFYRRRTEGKYAGLRFVATLLLIGSVLAFSLHHALTARDTRELQATFSESFDFVKMLLV